MPRMVTDRDEALERAIKAAGSQTELAARVGVKLGSLNNWRRVPVRRVLAVEHASGVPRHELRPDIYPPPADQRCA